MTDPDYEFDDFDDSDFDNEDADEWEEAASLCGRGQDYEGCMEAGTEYCEFECPFRDEQDEDDEDDDY